MLEKLREQDHLLNKAIIDFYAGDTVAALSIAVIVRTLVHETKGSEGRKGSTPLLKLLTPTYKALEIKDKAPEEADAFEANARKGHVTSFCPLGFSIGPSGVFPRADLSSPIYKYVPLASWWKRACLIFPMGPVTNFSQAQHAMFSKKDLTLILANKEGGAHVDVDLPKDYVDLIGNSPIRAVVNGRESEPLNLARFSVAQTGVELQECVRRNCLK